MPKLTICSRNSDARWVAGSPLQRARQRKLVWVPTGSDSGSDEVVGRELFGEQG